MVITECFQFINKYSTICSLLIPSLFIFRLFNSISGLSKQTKLLGIALTFKLYSFPKWLTHSLATIIKESFPLLARLDWKQKVEKGQITKGAFDIKYISSFIFPSKIKCNFQPLNNSFIFEDCKKGRIVRSHFWKCWDVSHPCEILLFFNNWKMKWTVFGVFLTLLRSLLL